jgi:transcriptional regulator with XRE-family HTH domain
MATHRLPNYLKTHRRRCGLTQRDVAFLLGNGDGAQISRYERHHRIPPLETALLFEAIFKTPVAELFGGLFDSARVEAENRVHELVSRLQEKDAIDVISPKKLLWLTKTPGDGDNQEGIAL